MKVLINVRGTKKGIELSGPKKNFDEICKTLLAHGFYNLETTEDGKNKVNVFYPGSVIEKISEVPVVAEKKVEDGK